MRPRGSWDTTRASTPTGPFVEVSGRKGLGVKADDLLDRLTDKAAGEVAKRNPDLPAADRRAIAEAIAVAAVRYFMVKFSRGKVIVFDIDEALSFEGESGPYLQYAVVRANNIFAKLKERDGTDAAALIAALATTAPDVLTGSSDESLDLWGLILEAARLDDVVEQAVRTLELSVLAKYAFGLAQAVQRLLSPLLDSQGGAPGRAHLARRRRRLLPHPADTALELMGCAVPVKM